MVTLRLYTDTITGTEVTSNYMELYYKINIVTGDSGSGKTFFLSNLTKAINGVDFWHVDCNKDILIVHDLQIVDYIMNITDKLIIIDENEIDALNKRKLLSKLLQTHNYFLLLDRDRLVSDINVNAVYELLEGSTIEKVRTFELVKRFKLEHSKISFNSGMFAGIITEDSKSGRDFWDSMFSGLNVINTTYGNGQVYVEIKKAQANTNNLLLIALDYDRGASCMLAIHRDTSIDQSKLVYVSMESFEEVLCNSEFILQAFPEMRDKVINYKNYLDATYKHAGKYFSKLLHKYVKQPSPFAKPGDANYEKFYSKGMQNFTECFIDECCTYNGLQGFTCKLQMVNKRDKLLNNKFESLNQLR